MSLEISLMLSQEVRQHLTLTLEQQQHIEMAGVHLRLALVSAFRGCTYEPEGDCPGCGHRLKPVEILKGFNDDPQDFTTGCPKCQIRFRPRLYTKMGQAVRIQHAFYCPAQTLNWLRAANSQLPSAEVERQHGAWYQSAIVHFGSLRNAFQRIGVDYPEDPKPACWQDRVRDFLGRLADTVIAEAVSVPRKEIAALRKQLGVRSFNQRRLLREVV